MPESGALSPPLHGGPDALGAPLHDFSTNSNACGPCPAAQAAVQQADATRYPDPAYTALRAQLGALHGVAPGRIVLAGSASEFIHRMTALAAQQGACSVVLPEHSYGDYAQAAQARGLQVLRPADAGSGAAGLHWACEPSSPLGWADPVLAAWAQVPALAAPLRVLDCAYAPLRLGASTPPAVLHGVWRLWTPNKALGLTGVRAAYAVAPRGSEALVDALTALAPSWPVGAHGVALLQAWAQPQVQRWLAQSLLTLHAWKQRQMALCTALGWAVQPGSQANYFCAQPPALALADALPHLRAAGIKLRECSSFGLPGMVRLGVLPPVSQEALRMAWGALISSTPKDTP